MSSWLKASRRQQGNANGSAQPLMLFRRSAPYPSREEKSEDAKDVPDSAQPLMLFRRSAPYPNREEKSEKLKDVLDSYKELEKKQNYGDGVTYDSTKNQINAKPEITPADRRKTLYQKYYKQVQGDQPAADCVIISVTNQCLDYPKSLKQCLQERGLSVEMLYLQAESGLTQALQDVRGVGSSLCILVEQTNITLSSCTVIIFSEPLKIHRNMPKDQALDFVVDEHRRGAGQESKQRDPADIASQASQLLGEFLDREKIERHVVPSAIRQSLLLLSEGVHVYAEELEAISAFVLARQEHLKAKNNGEQKGKMFPSAPGKPPPLLPTPLGPPQCASEAGRPLIGSSPPRLMPLLPTPGSCLKTKPPPLLSLQQVPSLHNSYSGSSLLRSPLLQHLPQRHQSPRGSQSMGPTTPSPRSFRPPLLATPGVPHLSVSRH